MIDVDIQEKVEQAVELVKNAENIVAFTGAGISTASGIPDFRSPSSGLWKQHDPMIVASLMGFRQNPQAFFDWVSPLLDTIQSAQPTKAHTALATLEKHGKLKAIITQNIDNLHQVAGNKTVYEIHGHIRTATCTHCFKKYDAAPLIEQLRNQQTLPYCNCQSRGSVIKPDVILFGEQLPKETVQEALKTLAKANLLIVVGSSLRVEPASYLPFTAINHGAKVIIINYEPTPVDHVANVVINDDVEKILPQIVGTLDAKV